MHDTIMIPEALKQLDLHEVQHVGESCVVSYRNDQHDQTAQVLMTHLSVIHVRRGTKRIGSGTQQVEVSAPAFVVCRPGVHLMTEFVTRDDELFASTVFFLGEDLLKTLGDEYPELKDAQRGDDMLYGESLEGHDELRGLLDQVFELFPRLDDERLIALKLRELVLWLGRSPASGLLHAEIQKVHDCPDVRLRHVVESQASHNLTLTEIATLSGRSLSTFKRDFERLYAQTPGRWVRARRLAHARVLLSSGAHNVTEVCMMAGFGNLSHFIRAFRQDCGLTPKQYQKGRARA